MGEMPLGPSLTVGFFSSSRMGGMPYMTKPRGDLKGVRIGGDRFLCRWFGNRRDRHAQLPVAMVEFANEEFLVFGHNDTADNSIALLNDPRGYTAIAT